jgi:hypothetical protein
MILSRYHPRKGVNQADHSRIRGLIVAIALGPAHDATGPFGSANAAATSSRVEPDRSIRLNILTRWRPRGHCLDSGLAARNHDLVGPSALPVRPNELLLRLGSRRRPAQAKFERDLSFVDQVLQDEIPLCGRSKDPIEHSSPNDVTVTAISPRSVTLDSPPLGFFIGLKIFAARQPT